MNTGRFVMYSYEYRRPFLEFVEDLFETKWLWMLLIAMTAVAIYLSGLENDMVCVIEYMDGDVERIECITADIDRPLFGSTTALKIMIKDKDDITKSLSTIKRWRLDRLE